MSPLISVVIPAYNEAANLPVVAQRLHTVLQDYDYEIIFVNDGSHDNTEDVLRSLNKQCQYWRYVSLSRNFGHQMALRAGLSFAKGKAVVSMDADLQHPPELLLEMIEYWQKGYDVVATLRQPDAHLSLFKKITSSLFYKILRNITDIELEEGAADFRLLDKKVVDYINQFPENELFLRGTIAWIGFKQYKMLYKPAERFSGTTKYSFAKMFRLAMAGITSFTTKPLYLSVLVGFLISLFALGFGATAVYDYYRGNTVSGWTSTVIIVVLIGGIQLLMMGIIGIYLGKMFYEVKRRPPFVVQESSFETAYSYDRH